MIRTGTIVLYANGGPYWPTTVAQRNIIYTSSDVGSNFTASPLSLALGSGDAQNGAAQYAAPLVFQGSTVKSNISIADVSIFLMPAQYIWIWPSGCTFSYCDENMENPVAVPELAPNFIFPGQSLTGSMTGFSKTGIFLDWKNNPFAVAGTPWTLCITKIDAICNLFALVGATNPANAFPFLRIVFESL